VPPLFGERIQRRKDLLAEIARLRERLQEAEATLGAIREGEVDAFVVHHPVGTRVYTLGTEELVGQLRVITNALPILVSYVDRERCYRFVSQRYDAWFGQPGRELLGRTMSDLPGAPDAALVEHAERALAGQTVAFESWMDTPTGRRAMHGTCVPHVHEGEVQGFVVLLEDVTERRHAEAALREREAELLQAKEEAEAANLAKDRFLATLSHELRTPLAPVLAVVSALQQDAGLAAEVQRGLAVVRKNVELEARLIDDLLDLTRISRGTLELQSEVVDLHQVIVSAFETLRLPEALAGRIALHTELAEDAAPVWADPARLTQVLCNLLSNALKFTPEGGMVTVRSRRDGESWAVEVADTGIGIEPERLATIFGAFDQGRPETARRFGGLGLGLTISRAILELHGGEIAAASAGPGRGATVTLRLPADLPPVEAAVRPAPEAEEQGAERPLSILLVEDHADTAAALAELIRLMGHRVQVAGGVAEALAVAQEGPAPDLLISDLGLPDGSGLEVMRGFAARGVPGIALSGYGMEEDLERSRKAGFVRHLTKPVAFDRLARTLRDLTRESEPGAR
jgi:PAS domain S-box-containing protein